MAYGFQIYDENNVLVLADTSLLLKEFSILSFSITITGTPGNPNRNYDIAGPNVLTNGKFVPMLISSTKNLILSINLSNFIHIYVYSPILNVGTVVTGNIKVYKL